MYKTFPKTSLPNIKISKQNIYIIEYFDYFNDLQKNM